MAITAITPTTTAAASMGIQIKVVSLQRSKFKITTGIVFAVGAALCFSKNEKNILGKQTLTHQPTKEANNPLKEQWQGILVNSI